MPALIFSFYAPCLRACLHASVTQAKLAVAEECEVLKEAMKHDKVEQEKYESVRRACGFTACRRGRRPYV